ncbi:MAG TPA: preprotein translocase subunit YajC [bacterium]|jgi:preprotein translocase subunit YajC|nr:preprotein translocase subunit YajC [bacterium]
MSFLYADTPALAGAAPAAADAAAPMSPLDGILHSPLPVMIIIFGLFYWLFIRPQQKQAKEREAQLKELKEGDKVILVSGVFATVAKVEGDDVLRLQIADGVTIKAKRTAVDRKDA